MTLLELLVKELPNRGGWPEGAIRAWQNCADNEVYFDDVNMSTVGKRNSRSNYFSTSVSNRGSEYAVTREQYEAAQQPVWNGEGLPPVGVECEVKCEDHDDFEWVKIHVVHVHNGEVIGIADMPGSRIHDNIGKYSSGYNCASFRPIRTESECTREDAIAKMVTAPKPCGHTIYYICREIYDAIAAGKIPGVELTK